MADAVHAAEDDKLQDELGDLLFQTYLLSLLLEERGAGDLEAVARRIHGKLVRRHPHVFGPAEEGADGLPREPREVKARWDDLKSIQEDRRGIFHHVPDALPALVRAQKVQRRAAGVGFEYPHVHGAFADLTDEIAELRRELPVDDPPAETAPDGRHFDELGDVLFACVNVARRLNVDSELALRAATDRFRDRVLAAERLAGEEGRRFADLPLAEQYRFFDLAKEAERG